ncbi:EAL domain-containing protein [Paenibacillus sp. GbtcB18]|uniref:EAL domain-containing protein n=1 Tax=Paenibacillus sp. GbtcB18 TaxID=2824763 RepID=UPI0020C5FD5F|nr:EAL domain-containing protein [Paenibacillus sp. GbtcB18]
MEIPTEKGQKVLPFYRTLNKALIENPPVGIYAMEDGALTYANDSYAKLVGYAAEKIRPAEFGFLEPDDCPITVPLFSEPDDRRKDAPVRVSMRHKDGHVLSIMEDKRTGISSDAFGAGYTSLNGKQITTAIISLAHIFHMDVVAEGIENELQHKHLLGENCNDGQGYYFSCPLPADSLAGLLNRP